jgi:hypothetical protein
MFINCEQKVHINSGEQSLKYFNHLTYKYKSVMVIMFKYNLLILKIILCQKKPYNQK